MLNSMDNLNTYFICSKKKFVILFTVLLPTNSYISWEDIKAARDTTFTWPGTADFPFDHQLTTLHHAYSRVFGVTDEVLTEMSRDRDFVQDNMLS